MRNVIERCFGVLKARFPILKTMPSYPYPTQVYIVVACMTVHNFIRQEIAADWLMRRYEDSDYESSDESSDSSDEDLYPEDEPMSSSQRVQQIHMEGVRDSIANAIAIDNDVNID